MEYQQGDEVIVIANVLALNTRNKSKKKIKGFFIRDYGSYIQIYDKYHLRRSILKVDIIKIGKVKEPGGM